MPDLLNLQYFFFDVVVIFKGVKYLISPSLRPLLCSSMLIYYDFDLDFNFLTRFLPIQ